MIKKHVEAPRFDREHFVEFMTLFGSAQQSLKDLMGREPELAGGGIGPMHFRALCICVENPGAAQQHLAKAMGRDKGQIARIARDLEERGLLAREPDGDDKRAFRLTATNAGVERSVWFKSLEERVARKMFSGLASSNMDGLAQALALMRCGLEGAEHTPIEKQL